MRAVAILVALARWGKGDWFNLALILLLAFAVGMLLPSALRDRGVATHEPATVSTRDEILADPFVRSDYVAVGDGRIGVFLPRGGAAVLLVLDDVTSAVDISTVCDGERTSVGRFAARLYGIPGNSESNSVVLSGTRDCTVLVLAWDGGGAELALNPPPPVEVVVAAQ